MHQTPNNSVMIASPIPAKDSEHFSNIIESFTLPPETTPAEFFDFFGNGLTLDHDFVPFASNKKGMLISILNSYNFSFHNKVFFISIRDLYDYSTGKRVDMDFMRRYNLYATDATSASNAFDIIFNPPINDLCIFDSLYDKVLYVDHEQRTAFETLASGCQTVRRNGNRFT
jgi:hypothetical protein